MRINYNTSGKERKRLAETIAREIGVDAIYKKAPTFAYEMDYFHLDKDGVLTFDDKYGGDEVERVLDAIAAADFEPADDEDANRKGIAIQMPMMDGDSISRLEALIESKETLIKKAIGTDSLAVGERDGKLDFPWFKADASPDEVIAYTHFVTALCRTAKEAKRVIAKDKPVENEKYAFRCFLLKLGFIGDEFKESRKVLLGNFTGNSAWKSGAPEKEVKA